MSLIQTPKLAQVSIASAKDFIPLASVEATNDSAGAIGQAVSVTAIEAYLVDLEREEALTRDLLDQAVSSQRQLYRDVARLDLLRAQAGAFAVSTRSISNNVVSNASSSAGKISNAVKLLDIEQARVKRTLDVVELVSELKACVLGVTGSMGAPQDWESAAAYLSRASKVPPAIVNGSFAEKTVPTAEVPDPPSITLAQAADSLRSLFLREFEKAASEGNGGRVTRFFKLFPLIGKPEVGLEIYGRYVCQGVASRARANLHYGAGGLQQKDKLFFAGALTKLFEHIAQIIDSHGGLVERHYGPGRMVKVIETLQAEADVQGGIILDTWSDDRNIDRKLTNIRSYAFAFLVQSFLPTSASRIGTPRTGSPAKRGTTGDDQVKEDDIVDMKDIDNSTSEMSLMLGRWSLYAKYIANKCNTTKSQDEAPKLPALIANSNLQRKISSRLIAPLNAMTAFYFRRSVEKAFQLDEQPPNLSLDEKRSLETNPPYITSAVDDVMYIVSQILDKTLRTSQRAVVANVVPTVSRVLNSDFIGMMQRRMRDESYPKAPTKGALPPEHITIAFLVLLNNLDVAADYTRRIVEARIATSSADNKARLEGDSASDSLFTLFPIDQDALFVRSSLSALESSFDAKAAELIGDGVFVLFKNVVKPRLRPLLADAFRDVDYQMTHEELEQAHAMAEAEGRQDSNGDGVVSVLFQEGWDTLTRPIIRLLTSRNVERLLGLIVSYLGEVLEKRIWSYYGRLDNLGGVRLERDIAGLVNVVVRGGRYRLREAFARCTEICVLMNMEADEWEGMKTTTVFEERDSDWQLNADERSRARTMIDR